MILTRGDASFIVDPMVVWDDGKKALAASGKKKVDKYERIITATQTLTGTTSCIVYPLVVGARGAWPAGNRPLMELLEAPRGWMRMVSLLALAKTKEIVFVSWIHKQDHKFLIMAHSRGWVPGRGAHPRGLTPVSIPMRA